mgnify:CR=1 FL=1
MKRVFLLAIMGVYVLCCNQQQPANSSSLPEEDIKPVGKTDTLEVETEVAEIRTFTYLVQACGKIKAAYE